jgi:hypothetical protein
MKIIIKILKYLFDFIIKIFPFVTTALAIYGILRFASIYVPFIYFMLIMMFSLYLFSFWAVKNRSRKKENIRWNYIFSFLLENKVVIEKMLDTIETNIETIKRFSSQNKLHSKNHQLQNVLEEIGDSIDNYYQFCDAKENFNFTLDELFENLVTYNYGMDRDDMEVLISFIPEFDKNTVLESNFSVLFEVIILLFKILQDDDVIWKNNKIEINVIKTFNYLTLELQRKKSDSKQIPNQPKESEINEFYKSANTLTRMIYCRLYEYSPKEYLKYTLIILH